MENNFRILRVPSHRTLNRVDFRGKRVLVRFDFNVPIIDGKIDDTRRIEAGLPTLKKILERGAEQVFIICHFGRPEGADPKFSTLPIAKVLSNFLRSKDKIETVKTESKSPTLAKYYKITDQVNIFENLRFDPGEEKNSVDFAKMMSLFGDCFVLDAFANIHREHASMLALQDQLPTYVGLLVEKEINALFKILYNPEKPFVAVIGGAKVEDKLEVIRALSEKADAVLIGGMTANEWILDGHAKTGNIFLPNDGINKFGAMVSMDPEFIKRGVFDIGPQTIMLFKSILSSAKTIFWNGNLGVTEDKKFVHGTYEIARYMTKIKAEKVVSGGNTADVIDELGLQASFDFISTGGSATSDLIAGKKLPVLEKLLK